MKTNNKRRAFAALTAGLLALTPVVTAGMTAFAASITVNQKANDALDHDYYAYALITGEYSKDENNKETLSDMQWNTNVVNLSKLAEALNSFDGISDVTNEITPEDFIKKIAGIDPQELTRAFITYGVLKTEGVKLDKQTSGDKTTGYKANGLTAGWYLIVDETESLSTGSEQAGNKKDTVRSANLLQVIGDEEIDPKFSLPSIDKKITSPTTNLDATDGKFNSAAIGDTVKYEITIPVPDVTGYDKYYYVVDDTLSKGLTYTEGSLKVELTCKGSEPKCSKEELTLDTNTSDTEKKDYYVTTNTVDGGTQIKVIFQDALKQFAGYHAGDTITITYDAVLNENAVITDAGNPNTAKLVYSNDPNYDWNGKENDGPGTPPGDDEPPTIPPGGNEKSPTGETPDSKVKTYTTAIQIQKVDQDGKPLTEDVEFTLTGDALNQVVTYTVSFTADPDGNYYRLSNGSYTTEEPTDENNKNGEYASTTEKFKKVVTQDTKMGLGTSQTTITAEVDDNGYITFYGLNAGTYTLSESKKPDGYNSISDITFTIGNDPAATFDSANWIITVTSGNATFEKVDDGVFKVTIENRMGSQLPETGGIGTKLFYIVGGMLAAGSAIVLVTRKRMSKES